MWTYGGSTLYHSANYGSNWNEVTLPYTYGAHNCGSGVAVDTVNKYVFSSSEGILILFMGNLM